MKKKKNRLLFVCYGNICRSPMAEGIARSAGIAATGGPASAEAVLVMKLVYNVDISSHIARPVGIYDIAAFDHVIALDVSIFNHLRDIWGVPEAVLYGWDIEDPLGQGYDAYKGTARKIERRLEQFLAAHGLDA
jgi:protein-tyrosine-phosphatase